ncbi:MarR family transcriptional regulator [Arthrobacter sp. NEB 688]|uniref:MarR family winged helix-turn-helix transcriptional regulator n=1 Tax=Arthrobacter sp. NEB 688 TaxID=904039 RepID=UPI0015654CC4|nr:MarR family transcriptional regulator [Arthrobacter sp. NEB 688]QKE82898.1 MarR family transcriptional regulator [Arthrobacter sp. NEB 688]
METRWLDEREERAWRGFHALRSGLTAHLGRELARASDLTEADYAVLVALSEAPEGAVRFRDLGCALGWERSRLSRQVARMEGRGTVERRACAGDARGFDVHLTAEGERAIEAAAPAHLAAVRHCFVDLLTPEQLDTLAEVAEVVTRHLADEHGPRSGEADDA